MATAAGTSTAVLMTGPPEARVPWVAVDAAPGFYRLRVRGLGPDREVVEDELRFEVPAAAPAPFEAAFPREAPPERRLGDAEPLRLEVLGEPAAGEDLLVLAWDPQRLEMREDFAHVIDAPPFEIDGDRLASLQPGEVELQVVRRRDGEVLGIVKQPLDVVAELTDPQPQPLPEQVIASTPTPPTAAASAAGSEPAVLSLAAEPGGTDAAGSSGAAQPGASGGEAASAPAAGSGSGPSGQAGRTSSRAARVDAIRASEQPTTASSEASAPPAAVAPPPPPSPRRSAASKRLPRPRTLRPSTSTRPATPRRIRPPRPGQLPHPRPGPRPGQRRR